MARVWDLSRHSGSDLLMLLAIADFSDDNGNAYPAVPTLAEKCRMTPRNANLILANLKKSGELVVKQNEGPKGTNRYLIRLATPEAGFTPEDSFTLKRASSTPEAGFPKPLKPASDEPSVNHQEPPIAHDAKKQRRVSSPSASESTEDGFADFWSAYPKKVAKPKALKAWKKIKPAGQVLASLMAALEKQKASTDWLKDAGQFIPFPASWLNGRRWEDEAPPAADKTAAPALNPIFAGAI
jgi:hypothetical protein